MKSKYECRVKLHFAKSGEALAAKDAVQHELDTARNLRSITGIKVNKDILSLNINAHDAVALRASLNSALKLIGLVQKIWEVE